MNEETAVLKEVKLIPPHCSARTPSGGRCRMAISDPQTGLCFRHAVVHLKENSGDFSEALVCGIKDFHSAADLNHVLGELYKLLAADKISPRRGAVMAYTCRLLLRTLPAINDELEPEPQIIFDLPRPKRERCRLSRARLRQPHVRTRHPVQDACRPRRLRRLVLRPREMQMTHALPANFVAEPFLHAQRVCEGAALFGAKPD